MASSLPVERKEGLLTGDSKSSFLPTFVRRNPRAWGVGALAALAVVVTVSVVASGGDDSTSVSVDDEYTYGSKSEEIKGLQMEQLDGGDFEMGQDDGTDRSPAHTVGLTEFQMAQTEITNAQFIGFLNSAIDTPTVVVTEVGGHEVVLGTDAAVAGYIVMDLDGYEDEVNQCHISFNGSYFNMEDEAYADYPVTYISYYAALGFSRHYKCDLPTEAEWEFAARAGELDFEYPTVDGTLSAEVANYNGTEVKAVGSYDPNAYNIHDLAGNVREYVLDFYNETFYEYTDGAQDPVALLGNDTTDPYVQRGGSFLDAEEALQTTMRASGLWNGIAPDMGFRVVARPCEHPLARPCD